MKNKIHTIINNLPDNTYEAIRKIAEEGNVNVSTVHRLYNKGAGGPMIKNLVKVKDAINKLYDENLTLESIVEDSIK